ncbi:unnamed protein product [Cylindrotheca closterium]|uniref:RNA polymerase I-specific transcription initiation factor RRN3 n=1 Tax=Cylindrotheca closterium TaxID=2856 RepID=A0AAD2JPB8_9STRA|nr:unnamed protein product [Cylindrotheca closterium]
MTAALSIEDSTKRVLFGTPENDPGTTSTLSSSLLDGEERTSTNALATPQSSPNEKNPLLESSNIDYNLPHCSLPPLSQLQPVETFVLNAIKSRHDETPEATHVQGYKAIIDSLRRPTDPNMIRSVLISFRTAGSGSVLTMIAANPTIHAQLVHVVLRLNSTNPPKPPNSDDENAMKQFENLNKIYKEMHLLDAHLHFMLALVSAKSAHLIPVMTAVWRMLSMRVGLQPEMYHRLHAMMYTMFQLFPKARSDFFSIVATRFPHIKLDQSILCHYCKASFKVLEYLPSMRKQLIDTVVDKCLEIDVNIKIQDNGEVSIEEQKKEDSATEDATTESKDDNESPKQVSSKEQSIIDDLSEKLDSLLALLLEEIKKACKDYISAREMYYEIMPVFESTILTTHKAKFVQFCMFYACGLESGLVDNDYNYDDMEHVEHAILHRDFAAKLLEVVMDPYRATLTRQSGACYLASFISRASFVGPDTICEAISALLRWAEAYIQSLGQHGIHAADSRDQSEYHSLFYTVCQAAFYIMCFRGKEAMEFYKEVVAASTEEAGDVPSHIDLSPERWTRICCHQLQPLRYCLESVRSEFLHISHFFDLIGEEKLEKLFQDSKQMSTGRPKRRTASRISTLGTLSVRRRKGGVGGLGRGSNPLKSFFPFDPLLLRRAYDFIEPYYRDWSGSIEEEEEDESVTSEESEEDFFDMEAIDHDGNGNQAQEDHATQGRDVHGRSYSIDQSEADESTASVQAGMTTPNVQEKKDIQRKAWTEATKRPRSLSMENGSW